MKEASYITLKARSGKQSDLVNLLTRGATLVADTEPQTLVWAALKNDNEIVIFDTFADVAGRNAHFEGKAAAALHENAENLVDGGWDNGVLATIKNATILSGKTSNNPHEMTIATCVPVKAKSGQEEALAENFTSGAAIIEKTEPLTAYWYALRFSHNEFGVIDFFADQSGADAHFVGEVATSVKENAATLIVDGWDNGVLAKVKQCSVIAMTCK